MANGDTMTTIVAVAILGGFFALLWWRAGKHGSQIAADRDDLPYSVYTSEFDVECTLGALPDLLRRDGTAGEFPNKTDVVEADARRILFEESRHRAVAEFSQHGSGPEKRQFGLLLDLSGSMVNAMPATAGVLSSWRDWVAASGSSCTILGFTTRGWRGGLARKKWSSSGRPEYPGRLCALLHVKIAVSDTAPSMDEWHVLLRPDILRENVDGEALRWARSCLSGTAENCQRIIVISDGAPVDDSTLMENGSEFLSRDLIAAVSEIEDTGLEIHGVGLSYRVHEFYANAHYAETTDHLAAVLIEASS